MCKLTKIIFEFTVLIGVWLATEARTQKEPKIKGIGTKRPFDDFVEKSSLTYHFKKMTDHKLAGQTRRSYGKSIMQVIDRTDELINFDIDKVKVTEDLVNASRRYMEPYRGYLKGWARHRDYYKVRARIYELMKQTIYEVRDHIMIITDLRNKYGWHSLYKMGFLFSKLDDLSKSFEMVSQKNYILQRVARDQRGNWRDHLSPVLLAEMTERQLNHWFEFDLLIDVARINNDLARKTLRYMKTLDELDNWFTDAFDDVYHVYKVAAQDMQKRKEEKKRLEKIKKMRKQTPRRG